jgi:hypothetical protein
MTGTRCYCSAPTSAATQTADRQTRRLTMPRHCPLASPPRRRKYNAGKRQCHSCHPPNIGSLGRMSSTDLGRENVIVVMVGGSMPDPVQYARRPTPSFSQAVAGRGEPASDQTVPEQSLPPLTAQASNLFESVVAFVGDGCAVVDDTEYRQRLETCHACDHRNRKRCTACGCWIGLKAPRPRLRLPAGSMGRRMKDEGLGDGVPSVLVS